MPVKVTRKYIYVVEGREYTDQKEANAAAMEANQKEKQHTLELIIQQADSALAAANAIMTHFYVLNKNAGKVRGRNKRTGAIIADTTIIDP